MHDLNPGQLVYSRQFSSKSSTRSVVFGLALFPALTGCHQHVEQASPQVQQPPPPKIVGNAILSKIDLGPLLPHGAVVDYQLDVDFRHDGSPTSVIAVYKASRFVSDDTNLDVFDFVPGKGWMSSYSERLTVEGTQAESEINRIEGASGNEGLLKIMTFSGAGTTTNWSVLILQNGKFVSLPFTPMRDKLLRTRNYSFKGYNSVDFKGQEVIDLIPGYSALAAHPCPDEPSLEVRVLFTGAALQIKSVKEIPVDDSCRNSDSV